MPIQLQGRYIIEKQVVVTAFSGLRKSMDQSSQLDDVQSNKSMCRFNSQSNSRYGAYAINFRQEDDFLANSFHC